MRNNRVIAVLAILLATLVIVGSAAWIFRAEILQRLVRPWLEKAAGSALEAEVRIERISPTDGGLLFVNIAIRRDDGTFAAVIPELATDFTPAGLLDHRLQSVLLKRPELSLVPADKGNLPSFPERPPFEIEALQVADGKMAIRTPNGPVLLRTVELQSRGTQPIDFHLTAIVGEEKGQPLLLAGKILWRKGLTLTLEQVHWQKKPLLTSPLTFHLPSAGDGSDGGTFGLDRLESDQVEAIFSALNKNSPLPPDVHFTLVSPQVDFDWNKDGLRLRGGVKRAILRKKGTEIPLGKSSWVLDFFADGRPWRGTIEIGAGRIPLPKGALEHFRLTGRVESGEDTARFTRLEATARLAGEGVPAGELSARGSGEWGGGKWRLKLEELTARKLEYLSPTGEAGFTGGSLKSAGTISGKAGSAAIAVNFSGTLTVAEVLYGAFYADLSDLAGKWSLRGTCQTADSVLVADSLSFAVEKIGDLNLTGRIEPKAIHGGGKLHLVRLGEDFSRLLLPALQERFPAAKGLALVGSVAAEFALDSSPGTWHLRGTAFPAGMNFSRGSLAARGISGAVPFDAFTGNPPAAVSEKREKGTLSLAALSLGPARFEGKTLDLLSSPNRIEIPGAITFGVAKGRMKIEGTSLSRGAKGPEFSARIGIRDIDLETLTAELGWPPMAGRLDADLGRVAYADGALSAQGKMTAGAFGGLVSISGVRMEAPFSPYPLLFADIDFTGIDLYGLTRTFSFGAIRGVADGFIHDLRLFRFTPSRFEAVLETRNEGARDISVKALENLTVISQGGLSGALSRGIFRFIDFYRYRKIGIRCLLRQDVFVLQGTAREDSDRYLVYGGWLPPKIDILAPEHAISFKEMLKRLQRIERAE